MNIPDEAVQAAAEAMYEAESAGNWCPFEESGASVRLAYRSFARTALEAAAPCILSSATPTRSVQISVKEQ